MKQKTSFNQLWPSEKLEDFVELFWEHKNLDNTPTKMTVAPDSFFKLILEIQNGKIIAYFLTGLWTIEKEIVIPANTTVFGIKFKVLAPEFLLDREITSLLNAAIPIDEDYLNAKELTFDSFDTVKEHFEQKLLEKLSQKKSVEPKKLQLSQLLYTVDGDILVDDVSKQIAWSNRQISRYLNKYVGVSLKKYLNMQKCYAAYVQIRNGELFPEKGFYDQAHFIREIKKHTNETPKKLYKEHDDRFIQLNNIHRK